MINNPLRSRTSAYFRVSPGPRAGVARPPLSVFLGLVDATPNPHNHWGWDGKHNKWNECTLRYEGSMEDAKRGRAASTWIVARVLYEAFHGVVLERQTLENRCGLPSCINPEHHAAVTKDELAERRKICVVGDMGLNP